MLDQGQPQEEDAHQIGKKPADGNGHPDPRNPQGRQGGEDIGQGHPGAQGAHREHHRHPRPVHRPEVAVEEEEHADAQVEGPLDAQVPGAHGDDLGGLRPHEHRHQPGGQQAHRPADGQAEHHHPEHRPPGAPADALPLLGPEVLGHKGGEGVAEVLDGHVGQGVDLHRHGEGGHHRGAEAVHQPLDQEDAEVHHRLLQAGEARQAQQLPQGGPAPVAVLLPHPQGGEGFPGVQGQALPRQVLGEHRGQGRPLDPHGQGDHEEQVQADVQHHGNPQKEQGGGGVAHRAQEVGEEVIEEGGKDPPEDPEEIGPGEAGDVPRNAEKDQDGLYGQVDRQVQGQGDGPDEEEGLKDAVAQPGRVPPAKLDGEVDAAAHAQPQKDGGEKGHQSVGGPHRSQGPLPDELPHHPGVGQIVQLLQEVAQDQGEGKPQQAPGNAPLGQVAFGVHGGILSGENGLGSQCSTPGGETQMGRRGLTKRKQRFLRFLMEGEPADGYNREKRRKGRGKSRENPADFCTSRPRQRKFS